VIVGTAAYQCYSPIVGYSLPAASLTTQDADLATASPALAPENREDTLETILKRADPTFAAVPMQHLGWLMESPIRAVALYGAGIPLRVPAPARYAMHKLIVAQKRGQDTVKRTKDLYQAKSLIETLRQSDPWVLRDAYEDAAARGGREWRQPIRRSLKELDIEPRALTAKD
jgi:hypothetical protein